MSGQIAAPDPHRIAGDGPALRLEEIFHHLRMNMQSVPAAGVDLPEVGIFPYFAAMMLRNIFSPLFGNVHTGTFIAQQQIVAGEGFVAAVIIFQVFRCQALSRPLHPHPAFGDGQFPAFIIGHLLSAEAFFPAMNVHIPQQHDLAALPVVIGAIAINIHRILAEMHRPFQYHHPLPVTGHPPPRHLRMDQLRPALRCKSTGSQKQQQQQQAAGPREGKKN